MGIDYKAAVFVGLPREEFDQEQLSGWLDEGDLEVCPPYYDGNSEDYAICGFSFKISRTYGPSELVWDQDALEKLKGDFNKLTRLDAKVWLSPLGY